MTRTERMLLNAECGRLESENLRLEAEARAHVDTNRALVAEVERLRAEADRLCADIATACYRFSAYTHLGRLDLPREWHEWRGMRMAGLVSDSDEIAPAAGRTS